ncbi:MAG: c-type cytochrome [Betaproteobacteria bacterium]
MTRVAAGLALAALAGVTACSDASGVRADSTFRYRLAGPLVPATVTMVAAWDVPQNPLADATLPKSPLADEIRRGYRIFTDTPNEAPRLTHSRMSCSNCHLNAGQREKALPLVGVAGMFPEYSKRSAHLISLDDRIVDCFLRSENGAADPRALPQPTDAEVLAVSAYLTWLSRGFAVGKAPAWRGQNVILRDHLIPVERLDPSRGRALFVEKCSSCHGEDGQGVQIGDKKAGPLWGPASWNDGAGAARLYTLAGIVRYAMPYLDPGSLSDEEAQLIAAFITSQPRPSYPYKSRDYVVGGLPSDAVYYRRELAAEK